MLAGNVLEVHSSGFWSQEFINLWVAFEFRLASLTCSLCSCVSLHMLQQTASSLAGGLAAFLFWLVHPLLYKKEIPLHIA